MVSLLLLWKLSLSFITCGDEAEKKQFYELVADTFSVLIKSHNYIFD